MKVSYDKNGSGESYGIQYSGDVKQLIKALYHILVVKKVNMPLVSHHGTTIRLVDYKLRLSLSVRDWTHTNKGEGQLKLLFILLFVLSDENWFRTINEHGNSSNVQGMLMNLNLKKGFIEILKKCGFTIFDSWNADDMCHHMSVVVDQNYNSIPPHNPKYDDVFENFLAELKNVCEVHNLLVN